MIIKRLEVGDKRPWAQAGTDKTVIMKRACYVMIPEDEVEMEYTSRKEFSSEKSAYACLGRLQTQRAREGKPQRADK